MEDNPYSFQSFSHTATDDKAFRVVNVSMPMYECNIHCLSNAAYHGSRLEQEAPLFVGDVAYFPYVDLKDVYLRNFTAGSNSKIVATGTVPVAWLKAQLGLL